MSTTPEAAPHRKVIGKETQKLRVDLTENELKRANENLIGCLSDISAHEREATEIKAQLARKQKGLEAKRGNLHQLIVAGYEYRDVEVEKIADYDRGIILFCRVDTGAEVDVERMPEGVRQQELDLREKRQAAEDAARPTNPDDVVGDGDPWGAPSDGRAPIAELPPPSSDDIIDAEFVEGDAADDADGDGDDAGEGDDDEDLGDEDPAAEPSPEAPAAAAPAQPSSDEGLSSDERRVKHLVEWLPSQGEAVAREYLESADVEDVRAIYARALGEPAGRAQKRTMIPKIIEKLFSAPF